MTTNSGDRILHLLKTRGAQTAQDLAKQLRMTPMGARQHLQQLQNSDLVSTFDRKEKVGRPSRYWQLTPAAQRFFPDRHTELTLTLLENVREVFGEEGLMRVIEKREQQIKSLYRDKIDPQLPLVEKLQRLAELRSQEGYMAETIALGEGKWLFVENHCPICAAASRCRNFCSSEMEIFRRCLDATVERAEYIFEGARRCAYLIFSEPCDKIDTQ